jgi:hypothetical protein
MKSTAGSSACWRGFKGGESSRCWGLPGAWVRVVFFRFIMFSSRFSKRFIKRFTVSKTDCTGPGF